MINTKALQEQVASDSYLSRRGYIWRGFRMHPRGVVGLAILTLIVLACIFVPIFFPNPYSTPNLDPSLWHAPMGQVDPANGHLYLFGSDMIGRDNFTLLFQAGRLTLTVAVIPAILAVILGFLIGAFAGYYGGWVDSVIMRVVDFFMTFPLLPAYIISIRLLRPNTHQSALSTDVGGLMFALVAVFAVFGSLGVSRLVRGLTLSLRTQPFVEAARAMGASTFQILSRHIFPNTVGPLIIAGVFAVGDFVILEAILAYFGLSFRDAPPNVVVSWGNILASNEFQIWYVNNLNPFQEIRGYLSLMPCLLILITMLSLNSIGDALLSALSPRGRA